MLHFEIIHTEGTRSTTRRISLSDDARGADQYQALKSQGYQLKRVATEESVEADA
jgi:hypothetical protein